MKSAFFVIELKIICSVTVVSIVGGEFISILSSIK